jgi:ABC-type uncharacterized transport system permease subunit
METDRNYLLIATVLYGLGFLYGFVTILKGKKYQGLLLLGFVIGGFFTQTMGLNLRGAKVGSCPLGNLFEVIQFISWSLIMTFILIRYVFKLNLLGLFTTGLASILGFLSFVFPEWDRPYEHSLFNGNHWIELHASLAVYSYGVYALMGTVSIMYLLQHYSLKLKLPSKCYNFLPSIKESQNAIVKLLTTAMLFYSLASFVGVVYWVQNFQLVSSLKMVITLALWAITITLFISYKKNKIYGKKFAWSCIALFIIAFLSLIPVESDVQKSHNKGISDNTLPEIPSTNISDKQ